MEHRYHAFILCAFSIFVTVFDTSSAVVALPTIALEFGTDLPTAQWVIVGNSLTIAALLVPMGRLADLFGRKRIYVAGCTLFAIGAACAALAGSVIALIAARTLVGVGSAMTQGTAMAIIVSNFGVAERARMLGLQTGSVGLGGIAGPAVGGIMVGTIGWRMLFAMTALAMLFIAVLGQRVLLGHPTRPHGTRPPFDIAGAVSFSSALVVGLLTLTLAPEHGWTTPATLAGAALSMSLFIAFVMVERRHPAPMLDLNLFRNSAFALGALALVVAFMGISAMRFLAPFFLQVIKGFDPSQVGLLLMPAAMITAVVSPFAGRLADRFGVRLFANLGFAVAILGLLMFSRIALDTSAWTIVVGLMVLAFGLATFSPPNSVSILDSVDTGSHGVVTAFINLCRNMGNVIGIAFATTIVALTMAADGYAPSLSTVRSVADPAIFAAFTDGVTFACIVLLAVAVPVLGLLSVTAWHTRGQTRDTGD